MLSLAQRSATLRSPSAEAVPAAAAAASLAGSTGAPAGAAARRGSLLLAASKTAAARMNASHASYCSQPTWGSQSSPPVVEPGAPGSPPAAAAAAASAPASGPSWDLRWRSAQWRWNPALKVRIVLRSHGGLSGSSQSAGAHSFIGWPGEPPPMGLGPRQSSSVSGVGGGLKPASPSISAMTLLSRSSPTSENTQPRLSSCPTAVRSSSQAVFTSKLRCSSGGATAESRRGGASGVVLSPPGTGQQSRKTPSPARSSASFWLPPSISTAARKPRSARRQCPRRHTARARQ